MDKAALIDWYKGALRGRRNPPRAVLDEAEYRVPWHDIATRMVEYGYKGDAGEMRQRWDEIFQAELRLWANEILRSAGEKPIARRGR